MLKMREYLVLEGLAAKAAMTEMVTTRGGSLRFASLQGLALSFSLVDLKRLCEL